MSEHLTEATYLALIEESLPEAERARVEAHLEEDCELCEAFLAERSATDPMDGVIDRALVSIAPSSATADDIGFRRVERSMRGARTRIGIAGGLIAAAIAAIFLMPRESGQRFKGEEILVPRLELLVSRDGAIAPIGREAKVRVGDTILFRIHLEQKGCVELYRDDAPLLDVPACFAAGERVLEIDGTPLGWAAKVAGRVEFAIVVAGTHEPPPEMARFPIIVEDR